MKPSPPSELHPVDDLAAHALDALDGPERGVLDHHLARCRTCRAELDVLRATAARLVHPVAPPPHLWGRIATSLPTPTTVGVLPDAGGQGLAGARGGAGAGEPVSGPGRRLAWRRRYAGVLAAAAAVAVVAGAVGFVTGRAGDRGSSSPDAVVLAEAALADPGNPRVALTDGRGAEVAHVVVGDRSGEGYVVLDALEPLGEGRTYQLWRLDGPTPVSLGVLGDGTTEALAVPLPSPSTGGAELLAITAEHTPGARAPTGPLVAQGLLPVA